MRTYSIHFEYQCTTCITLAVNIYKQIEHKTSKLKESHVAQTYAVRLLRSKLGSAKFRKFSSIPYHHKLRFDFSGFVVSNI